MTSRVTEEQRRAELADELVAAFGALARHLRATLPDALQTQLQAELGTTTPHQLEALHVLHHAQERGDAGLTMNELARRQGCALSSASALADRLLREGLVERVPDAADRRVVRLVSTAKGNALCTQFGTVKRNVTLDALRRLSVEELETLVALLRKATRHPVAAAAEEIVHD
jgi:DNA-binding MarR family transcriptional regulator